MDSGWYKAEQVKVENGRLKITAEKKEGSLNRRPASEKIDYPRVSGRIQTKQNFAFLYGKVYTKFKLPQGPT